MDKPYLFAGFVIFSIIVLAFLLYLICYYVDKICNKLVIKWETELYSKLGNPDKIVPLERDDFNEFLEVSTKYGDILSYERANEKTDQIIKYIAVERCETELSNKK